MGSQSKESDDTLEIEIDLGDISAGGKEAALQ